MGGSGKGRGVASGGSQGGRTQGGRMFVTPPSHSMGRRSDGVMPPESDGPLGSRKVKGKQPAPCLRMVNNLPKIPKVEKKRTASKEQWRWKWCSFGGIKMRCCLKKSRS